jgi:hypothetical protein
MARPAGCQDAWFPEVGAPGLRPADAHPPETAEWDASVSAHPDAAADAVSLELRPPSADVAEILVGRAPDAQVRDAKRRQSALPAAPEAEPPAAELCIPAVDQFAERSCAGPEVQIEEQPDATRWGPQVERSLKSLVELPRPEPVPLGAVSPDAQARSRVTMKLAKMKVPPEAQRPGAPQQPEPRVAQPPTPPETPLLASPPEAQPLQASLPE